MVGNFRIRIQHFILFIDNRDVRLISPESFFNLEENYVDKLCGLLSIRYWVLVFFLVFWLLFFCWILCVCGEEGGPLVYDINL